MTRIIWLVLAVACTSRGASPTPDPTGPDAGITVDLLAQWSGCMTFADFEAANMAPTWSAMRGQNEMCVECHSLGEGFVVSANATAYFNAMSVRRINLEQYFRVDGSTVAINLANFHSVGTDQTPHVQHPTFTIDAGLPALQSFYDQTLARFNAGTCGPPKLVD